MLQKVACPTKSLYLRWASWLARSPKSVCEGGCIEAGQTNCLIFPLVRSEYSQNERIIVPNFTNMALRHERRGDVRYTRRWDSFSASCPRRPTAPRPASSQPRMSASLQLVHFQPNEYLIPSQRINPSLIQKPRRINYGHNDPSLPPSAHRLQASLMPPHLTTSIVLPLLQPPTTAWSIR